MQVKFEKVDAPEKEEALIKAQSNTDDIKAAIELLENEKSPLLKTAKRFFWKHHSFITSNPWIKEPLYTQKMIALNPS